MLHVAESILMIKLVVEVAKLLRECGSYSILVMFVPD